MAKHERPDTQFMEFEGQRMAYSVYGKGPKVVCLTHGFLLNKDMYLKLAHDLADQGNRVVTLDMVGHGESEPRPAQLSIPFYGRAVLGVMDDLGVKEAVIGGTSLGANISLEVASQAPERVRGLLVEMPALEDAMLGGALAFAPLLAGAVFGEPIARVGSRILRLVPRGMVPYQVEMLLDVMRRDPRSTAQVITGVFFGRLAPPAEERRLIEAQALVIGHRFDPIHPMTDAKRLTEELRNSQFVEANSAVELRTTPTRLTNIIADFLSECWRPKAVKSSSARGTRKRTTG